MTDVSRKHPLTLGEPLMDTAQRDGRERLPSKQ
jgi:hypothetical protein